MKKSLVLGLIAIFSLMSMNTFAQKATAEAKKNLEAYPAATELLDRFVIYLDKKANENDYKVEVIGGKIAEVDCNVTRLNGGFSKEVVEGWGYDYLRFNSDGNMMKTMMICPDNKTKSEFVQATPIMVDYNSRLPIVVYAPKGYQVKYKIWSAGKLLNPTAK